MRASAEFLFKLAIQRSLFNFLGGTCVTKAALAGRNAEVSKAIAKLKFLLRNQTLSNFRGLFIWWATLIDCLILYPKFWIPFSRYFGR